MRTAGSRNALLFSIAMFILFGGYFAYAAFLNSQPASMPFIQPIAASDDEDDGDDQNQDEDKEDD